jgi:nucleoside-diphosphate-sugar epimerase
MADKLVIGCGYLGQRIAVCWREQGHRVFATTRRPERVVEWRRLGLEPIVCDVLDRASLRALPDAMTVVHCVGFDRSAAASMRQVYVEGLGHVLDELAGRAGRPRLIHVSSTSVYGQTQGEEVDERSATEPVEDSGRVVLEAERLLHRLCPAAVVLRFAGIYGPGRLLRPQALLAGEPLAGDPDRWLNLIHVEDGARAVLAAEERGHPGETYNISDDAPVRRRDFYTLLAQLLGTPEPRFLPSAAAPAEVSSRRVSNRRLRQELGVALRYRDCGDGLPASLP